MGAWMTLEQRFDARHNNFDLIRLMLAGIVAVAHGIVMRGGSQPEFGITTLADFGLDGFFILSGFLVARSWLTLSNFWRYAWHRFLRIMPAFWVCLLVLAFLVAPLALLLEGRPLSDLWTSENSAPKFVLVNAGLMIFEYEIADIFAGNPHPLIVDGSLWTLILEAGCYVVLACLGLAGALTRRRIVVPIFTALVWLLATLYDLGIQVGIGDETLRMLMLFMIGTTAYIYGHLVPMNLSLLVASVVVFLGSVMLLENYRIIGAVPFAYILLWFAVALPKTVRVKVDVSYGVYIYHWPIQQLMMLTVLSQLPPPLFIMLSFVFIVPVALASWFGIERRALRRKNARLPRWLPGVDRQPRATPADAANLGIRARNSP